jgi:hypothetical protein
MSGSQTPNNVVANLNQALVDIGGASRVFAIEGQNEANVNEPSGTAAAFVAGNNGMANAVRSISALAPAPILNLSLGTASLANASAFATAMGNQTANGIDWNSWHQFPNDGTGGGAPTPIGIAQLIGNQSVAGPGRPLNWTAVGYDPTLNPANGSHVTGTAGGKMLCSGIMNAYAAELASFIIFQLFPDSPTGFQLFATDGTPNRMATIVHNFTTVLLDTGATARTFTPGVLRYLLSFAGSGTSASSMLMQHSDGSFRLVLWNNDAVQTTGPTPSDVSPAASNVTITLSVACTSGGIYDPVSGTSPVSTFGAVTTIGPVAIQGYPKIVLIVP